MKENVLDVLIFLFDNYMFDAEEEPEEEVLVTELVQAGFSTGAVDQAFSWLEKLSDIHQKGSSLKLSARQLPIRHYIDEELQYLSADALLLIGKLERFGVLDMDLREIVIAQIVSLGAESIDAEQLRWVVMMVIVNYYDNDSMVDWSEAIVHDELQSCIH